MRNLGTNDKVNRFKFQQSTLDAKTLCTLGTNRIVLTEFFII